MKTLALENLHQLKQLACRISPMVYMQKLEVLSGQSIGDHYYHIIDSYYQLMNGISPHTVNYMNHCADKDAAKLPQAAVESIDSIISAINTINLHQDITVETVLLGETTDKAFNSSLGRELAYCIEHSTHHQTLIKTALSELKRTRLIDNSFGLTTTASKQQKAQFV